MTQSFPYYATKTEDVENVWMQDSVAKGRLVKHDKHLEVSRIGFGIEPYRKQRQVDCKSLLIDFG